MLKACVPITFPPLAAHPFSNAFFISAFGMMAVRASSMQVQSAVLEPSAVPYSMTPPATGTKQTDLMPSSAAVSLRIMLESITSCERQKWARSGGGGGE